MCRSQIHDAGSQVVRNGNEMSTVTNLGKVDKKDIELEVYTGDKGFVFPILSGSLTQREDKITFMSESKQSEKSEKPVQSETRSHIPS